MGSLARVTYLLAIGRERIQADDRPPLSVPVYLGDSLQWGQQHNVLSAGGLTVSTEDGLQLFANELRFPSGCSKTPAASTSGGRARPTVERAHGRVRDPLAGGYLSPVRGDPAGGGDSWTDVPGDVRAARPGP